MSSLARTQLQVHCIVGLSAESSVRAMDTFFLSHLEFLRALYKFVHSDKMADNVEQNIVNRQ